MSAFLDRSRLKTYWDPASKLESKNFRCGFCGDNVLSSLGTTVVTKGTANEALANHIYYCPSCCGPNYFSYEGLRFPDVRFGQSVQHVPGEVDRLYEEARNCAGNSCYTAAVMICRKLLMHLAVDKGAAPNLRFVEYVNYLADNNHIPTDSRPWVDHIRDKGNEANHEIKLMDRGDAETLIAFVEILLKLFYEFPNRIPVKKP